MSLAASSEIIVDRKVVTFTYVILDVNGHGLAQSDLPMSYSHGIDDKMFPKVEAALQELRTGETLNMSGPFSVQ